ncbi:hypothetical protein QWM81_20055 [Streptomyces ficellus]|uniref:Dirigent protein n=1 Tax=Streptomyces ficellus TaxID=1977088 RepID=A0ABT7Z9X6_9ACTN|nr:hypothetical protein [Streptomyces ficellus]MDN3296316.1 hypothetical protein [Streptomyces ficellus]
MLRTRVRRLAVGVLTAATATLTLTATAHAAPVPTPKDTKETKEQVKVLNWLGVKQTDTKPERVRVGADWTVYGHLFEDRKGRPGKKIGDATAHCSAVDVRRHGIVTLCQRVLRTDAGSITLTDTLDRFGRPPHGGKSAITGGTGAYADAEGQATIVLYGSHVTYRIALDD